MREGEKEGEIYHFYSKERFEKGIRENEFLEYAMVHQDYYYGLIKKPILDALQADKTIIREVDIQGFENIRESIPKNKLITIFITAGNKHELVDRIINRAPISEDELNKRKESMHAEFAKSKECDYLVENKQGGLKDTVRRVIEIIEKEIKK